MSEKDKKDKRSRTAEKEEKNPHRWELTDEDKAFLRTCNIRAD